MKKIDGKRIYLRLLTEKDASQKYCNWLNDPKVNKYLDTRDVTLNELKNYIREKKEKSDCLFFGIFTKDNDIHIGNVKLEPIDLKKKKAEFGILIGDTNYWGKGIGTEATSLIINYVFNNLNVDEIELGVLCENIPARKIYDKLGFKPVKIEKNYKKVGNKLFDNLIMVLKKKKRIVCIIQARMRSTRLPGKILKKIEGKEVLLHVIDRVLDSKLVDLVVIATTTNEEDMAIVDLIEGYDKQVEGFRGSENDVLDRYYRAAKKFGADIIIRITADCPLMDSDVIDKVVNRFLEIEDCDYVSNLLERSYPRGLDVEVFSFKALERAWNEGNSDADREHVTWYIRKNSDKFKSGNVKNEVDLSKYRWTLDVQEDLNLITKVFKRLYHKNPHFKTEEILDVFEKEPELFDINSDVEQKKTEGRES